MITSFLTIEQKEKLFEFINFCKKQGFKVSGREEEGFISDLTFHNMQVVRFYIGYLKVQTKMEKSSYANRIELSYKLEDVVSFNMNDLMIEKEMKQLQNIILDLVEQYKVLKNSIKLKEIEKDFKDDL